MVVTSIVRDSDLNKRKPSDLANNLTDLHTVCFLTHVDNVGIILDA